MADGTTTDMDTTQDETQDQDQNNNRDDSSERDEVTRLQQEALLERDRTIRIQNERLAEYERNASKPREEKQEEDVAFMTDPDKKIAALTANFATMLKAATDPINAEMAINRKERLLNNVRSQINAVPKLKAAYDVVGPQVDEILRGASVINEQTVVTAIQVAMGNHIMNGGSVSTTREEKKDERRSNITLSNDNTRERVEKKSSESVEMKKIIDALTERERKELKSFKMTPEQYAKGVLAGLGSGGQESFTDIDDIFKEEKK